MVTVIKKGTDKKELQKILEKLKPRKRFNAKKYSGILKLEEDPLVIQQRLRDEWE